MLEEQRQGVLNGVGIETKAKLTRKTQPYVKEKVRAYEK